MAGATSSDRFTESVVQLVLRACSYYCKPALAPAAQQFFTTDWRQFVKPPPRADSWYEWLSEPVRVKPALREGAQQAFATDVFCGKPTQLFS
jgi:hypothetical protein